MQAVIMAGGHGTRLLSASKETPKPMVRIGDAPLLEHQIHNLRENGVDNIILILCHLADVIRSYFGNGEKFGVHITYYVENSPLGTAGALTKIADQLDEHFILVFGDLFFDIDLRRFWDYHLRKSALITLFVHPNSHPYDSDIVLTDKDGRVTGWSRKNDPFREDCPNTVNAGLYLIEKSVIPTLEEAQERRCEDKLDLEKDVIIPLIPSSCIYAYHSTEYVKDMGTPDRLESVTSDFTSGIIARRNLSHKQRCIFLDRDGTINRFVGLVKSREELELEPRAARAIEMINHSGYLAVVITNQPVLARGECSPEEMTRIHDHLHTLLGKEGAYLDGLYFCPHHPDRGYEGEVPELKIDCDCRKPKTGLIREAASDLNIDLTNSWFIGDTSIDVLAGKNAGMRTIMLSSGSPDKGDLSIVPDQIADDLLEAVEYIMANR